MLSASPTPPCNIQCVYVNNTVCMSTIQCVYQQYSVYVNNTVCMSTQLEYVVSTTIIIQVYTQQTSEYAHCIPL